MDNDILGPGKDILPDGPFNEDGTLKIANLPPSVVTSSGAESGDVPVGDGKGGVTWQPESGGLEAGNAGEAGKALKADDAGLALLIGSGVIAVAYDSEAEEWPPRPPLAGIVLWIGPESAGEPESRLDADLVAHEEGV